MAVEMERWFCTELCKLGIDTTEESARYILSIEDANDLEEYMRELLDATDPNVRVFLQELRFRWGQNGSNNGDFQVISKSTSPEVNSKKSGGKSGYNSKPPTFVQSDHKKQPQNELRNSLTVSNGSPPIESSKEIGVGAKKKTKFVALYSAEGQAKSVIQLPGRHTCECQAAKHTLINNCIQCGRVVCQQEGAGPCVFCGTLVCTPQDQEFISSGSKKGEKRRQALMKGSGLPDSSGGRGHQQQMLEKALQHRDKLLDYDRTSVRRTQVIDDESDYYATDSNRWLSKADREKLRKREEELRQARHGSRRDRKITFDFAGRRVVDAEEEVGKSMYDKDDAVIQEVHYGKSHVGSYGADIVNPTIVMEPPSFVDPGSAKELRNPKPDMVMRGSNRIQDRELQEMSDEGMCMSMHQPWASLLVEGIKIHEGRTWYTPHRGRLWIAATAKMPNTEEIAEMEQMYQCLYGGSQLEFPKAYPTACLLGCVNVDDCLAQDEYRQEYPEGESASPYVFICSNPQQLLVKFPMKGKHKIYKLEQHIHQAAKKGLR